MQYSGDIERWTGSTVARLKKARNVFRSTVMKAL